MTPYTTPHAATQLDLTSSSPNSTIPHSQRFVYDLTSVIVHKGSLDSGHYYAYCRESHHHPQNPSLQPPTDTDGPTMTREHWYLFNDDRVTLATTQEVLAADAYLLFYGIRWLPPMDPETEKMLAARCAQRSGAKHRVDLESSDSE